jgi:hypothetical protein
MSSKRKKGHLPPFVPLIRTTLASPAWKQLSFGARSLYVVLRSYLRVDNLNNGKVFRSYRDTAKDLGTKSRTSAQRWFRELEHFGFIVQTTGACLGVDGDGVAAHWRLTECPTFDAKGNHIAPTREFDRWDGTPFVDPDLGRWEGEKTESRPQNRDTSSLKQGHTDGPKPSRKRSRRPQNRDIDSAASMSLKQGHNCLPPPTASKPRARRQRKLPWSTPTVTEVTLDDLPVELRMMALGLSTEDAPATLATIEPAGHA